MLNLDVKIILRIFNRDIGGFIFKVVIFIKVNISQA